MPLADAYLGRLQTVLLAGESRHAACAHDLLMIKDMGSVIVIHFQAEEAWFKDRERNPIAPPQRGLRGTQTAANPHTLL